ncbi:MAG: NADH-quinone oxidoreductase subunit J [Armatimonadetes bacterium CG_4_10_14_3_um_filter_66_18]|nr:NADH-quinone oxidoreductase subunit J [Armatimonadota bacterium]OIO92378.1 MAG: hypothetical protein AUJ96_32310 [Armatimonadetes bacterium CG2_30_66_41]PIU93378.1 MAG: NADH-quinone oxidoreductase subunit J [Armatimonadetes bacterium CG06_land_8_20_14_3_00_66_21]PIX40093.1 MAG: NADH-quinone oxidoreductase subunit J [Armatimonadetes bacterium CG_4_8_14_3_um_filter_66_20]PIY40068.1 MAG: NADH-quinone oxidoreductase subunit J [Armatimonadetes bacterium CG_4_10_14_3_um_filter_66_18]PIZ37573.1 MA
MSETLQQLAFYTDAAMIVFAALMVVTLRNIFHCALFLALGFFGIAGIFVMLHAEFLAGVQVMIYVGAIAVLVLFAIMLTRGVTGQDMKQTNKQSPVAGAIALLFVVFLLKLMAGARFATSTVAPVKDSTAFLGQLLVTRYVLPFEVASIVLLMAMVGALLLAKEKEDE